MPRDQGIETARAVIPPELRAAPAWVSRTYSTNGIQQGPSDKLETATLRRSGDAVLLHVETSFRAGESDAWSAPSVEEYLGTLDSKSGALHAVPIESGSHHDQPFDLTCRSSTRLAAGPSAVLVSGTGHATNSCSETACWEPSVMKKIAVLVCDPAGFPPTSGVGIWDAMFVFAEAPGIERASVHEDTALNGDGFREIPRDGSVAPSQKQYR